MAKKVSNGAVAEIPVAPPQTEENGATEESKEESKIPKVKLTATQVRILQCLARNPAGLTRAQIQARAGAPALLSAPLGPTEKDDCKEFDKRYGYPSLHSLGYVTTEKHELSGGSTSIFFVITKDGEEAAGKYGTKKKPQKKNKIPRNVLVPVVKEFRLLRTYGYESYNDEDIKEIKDKLGSDWAHVSIEDVKQQIANARKVGAFKEEKQVELPEWYKKYLEGEHMETLRDRALKFVGDTCSLNTDHKEEVGIYHRTFANLYGEKRSDLVVLCKACHYKNRKSLPAVPDTDPALEEEQNTEKDE